MNARQKLILAIVRQYEAGSINYTAAEQALSGLGYDRDAARRVLLVNGVSPRWWEAKGGPHGNA